MLLSIEDSSRVGIWQERVNGSEWTSKMLR